MKIQQESVAKRRNPPPITQDEQPLLRALVSEATRRGDTLATLAKKLGVTYERLAQWRRNDAQIAKAHRSVLEKAASYLGLPTVLVLMMAGFAGLDDFIWPSQDPLKDRIGRDLERMRQHAYVGPFFPQELVVASQAITIFVLFLFNQLLEDRAPGESSARWLRPLYLAVLGNEQAQRELEVLNKQSVGNTSIF